MAGLWHLSLTQYRDALTGDVLVGALADFFASDSLERLTVYADYDLTRPLPNPVVAEGGVFPAVFFDENDNFYRMRIRKAGGDIVGGSDLPVIPIIGPSGGGGGSETPVDPTTLFKTGDSKWRLGAGVHTGWVRVNGRTIGSAVSGATERANADTELLYEHLWESFTNDVCPVTGGRGVSSTADFAANKPIALPDARGRTLAGLDDMGNSAASRLTAAVFATSGQGPTVLGAAAGAERHQLSRAQLPAVQPAITVNSSGAHTHDMTAPATNNQSTTPGWFTGNGTGSGTVATQSSGAHTHTASIENLGSGEQHNNTQPTMLATLYVKL